MTTKPDSQPTSKVVHLDFSRKLQEVERLPDRMWVIESSSQEGTYYVCMYYTATDSVLCTCPGWQFRNTCKHSDMALTQTKKKGK